MLRLFSNFAPFVPPPLAPQDSLPLIFSAVLKFAYSPRKSRGLAASPPPNHLTPSCVLYFDFQADFPLFSFLDFYLQVSTSAPFPPSPSPGGVCCFLGFSSAIQPFSHSAARHWSLNEIIG